MTYEQRLNAPFGARRFLTGLVTMLPFCFHRVLMHRLALGAF